MEDFELLLLSWTQLTAVQLIMGDESESSALRVIEEKLDTEYHINKVSLVGRTYDEYSVAYQQKGENQMIRFTAEEVESIYEA